MLLHRADVLLPGGNLGQGAGGLPRHGAQRRVRPGDAAPPQPPSADPGHPVRPGALQQGAPGPGHPRLRRGHQLHPLDAPKNSRGLLHADRRLRPV